MNMDPRTTGLLLFDLLERAREAVEDAGIIAPVQRLMKACRSVDVPIFHARGDHRADGADLATALSDTDNAYRPWTPDRHPPVVPEHAGDSPERKIMSEFGPEPHDYVIPKHRWNAFYQTHLELSLRTRGISTVIIVGGAAHIGIASTLYAGRDMDFNMVVAKDCLVGMQDQRDYLVTKVFPAFSRLRTANELIEQLVSAPR